jgi:hypothetical protein
MHAVAKAIRELVGRDELDQALNTLDRVAGANAPLSQDVILLRQRLSTAVRKRRLGLSTAAEDGRNRTELASSILQIVEELFDSAAQPVVTATVPSRHDSAAVFVSYSHRDQPVASRVKAALEQHGLAVRIDDQMNAGEDVRHFIERSVRDTAVTFAIVSNDSLLSTWVALEAFTTFGAEAVTMRRRFIAGYLDPDFFEPSYRLRATERIDAKIDEMETLARAHAAARIDTNDLNEEKSRLFELRHNLGSILERLRGSLTVSLADAQFDASVARIVTTLRESVT